MRARARRCPRRHPARRFTQWNASRESSIIDRPLRVVYDQWTQFQDFPGFVPALGEVRQLDATRLRCRGELSGRWSEWDVQITDQVPDTLISWKHITGSPAAGTVRFESLRTVSARRCGSSLPGTTPRIGLDAVASHVIEALESFRQFIETARRAHRRAGTARSTVASPKGTSSDMHEALNKPHWTSLRSVHRVSRSIDVDRPIREVYDQWTRFEDFPKFMFGVKKVVQLDANHLRWKASVWGRTEEWIAEITEQQPDSRISWKSVSGVPSAGTVRFQSLGEDRTLRDARRWRTSPAA